jgi:Predicted membrane protein
MLSWAPFIGDPITLVAGILREPLWSFVLIVALAKLTRYLVVAAALSWLG